jgi:large subunit ribosomal protein L7e
MESEAPATTTETQFVPETVLKRRNRDVKTAEQRALNRKHKVSTSRNKHDEPIKRVEKYVKEYKQGQKSFVDIKRRARTDNTFNVPSNVKTVLIIRIRGVKNLAPQVKKVLRLFRLGQIYNASFVRVNRATMNLLKRVERYVAFGYPSRKTVSDLIYKRGYAKVEAQRIPLTSNEIVEQYLGKQGFICIEDIVHELHNCGENFKEVNNFLWSFKLNEPKNALKDKNHPFSQGGDWGNREERINELLQDMI